MDVKLAVISTLAERADGHGKPLDVKVIGGNGGNGGAPSPAALAYARKIAAAIGGKIPPEDSLSRSHLCSVSSLCTLHTP